MKYLAIEFKETGKQCVSHGCPVPPLYMIVSAGTLKMRKRHPEYGIHYYACMAHKPAAAKVVQAPHEHAFGLVKLTPNVDTAGVQS